MAAAAAVEPLRVVSLLPSATELVCLVGAGPDGSAARLVGRSHECDWPASVVAASVPMLTAARTPFESMTQMHEAVNGQLSDAQQLGLYTLDAKQLRALRPDVIVTQSLCDVCSVDLRLVEAAIAAMWPAAAAADAPQERPPRVVCLNPFTLGEVLDDAAVIANTLAEELELRRGSSSSSSAGVNGDAQQQRQQQQEVKRLADTLRADAAAAVAALQARVTAASALVPAGLAADDRPTVAHLEWFEPVFPGGHWTPQLIHMAGGLHPLNPPTISATAGRPDGGTASVAAVAGGAPASRAVFNTELERLDPQFIIICCCGLDIAETVKQLPALTTRSFWRRLQAVRNRRVALVDGNQYFNRPGPRLVDCLEFLVGLLQPGRQSLIPEGFAWRWLAADDLAAGEAAWLAEHPEWPDSVQKGPPPPAAGADAQQAAGGCSTGRCGAPAQAPAAAVCE